MKSLLRLFKAISVGTKEGKVATEDLVKKCISKGFLFSPEVIYNYSEEDLLRFIEVVESEVGLSADKINNSFHKSWQKIKEADIEQLVMEQIVHYITTYGFEHLGIYNKDSVYIPNEKLEIPDVDIDEIKLVVIKGYTKEEIKEKLLRLLKSGIALKEETVKDAVDVATFVGLSINDLETIKNKEVKILLCDKLHIILENPTEFLRYVIYKATGKTLLIKDRATIEAIKENNDKAIDDLFFRYGETYGLGRLAEIFYRFKPLFLAFKGSSFRNGFINRIRKLAIKYHKPMKEDYLNEITNKIKNGVAIHNGTLREELSKVNTFRKIRLAYALKFRTTDSDAILYKIRNGKGYATSFAFKNKALALVGYDYVENSIIEDIKKKVKGKKIYIPEYMNYALPATEKQFTGSFPSGSYVSIDRDMLVGIHWENQENNRIDLDLSLINNTIGKIGWDSSYRTEDREVLFSGDVTDAPRPNGASELFYVKRKGLEEFLLVVNYYNYDSEIDVPFKIIVAKEQVEAMKQNYMVDPNKVLAIATSSLNQRQRILGLLVITNEECRFHFSETSIGKSITASTSQYNEDSKKYLSYFYKNTINFNEILEKAGAEIVREKEGCDIDLSPEILEKDTIINLLC